MPAVLQNQFVLKQAAKRGLDTIQSVASGKVSFLNVTKFAVEGGSKVNSEGKRERGGGNI